LLVVSRVGEEVRCARRSSVKMYVPGVPGAAEVSRIKMLNILIVETSLSISRGEVRVHLQLSFAFMRLVETARKLD
jgi:hypothetical protein